MNETKIVLLTIDNMSVYDDIISLARDKGYQYVDDILPYYISSVGSHILNLVNNGSTIDNLLVDVPNRTIVSRFGYPEDTRLHILLVAPVGYSKTTFTKLFIRPNYGILSGIFPVERARMITEAGFIGSVVGKDFQYGSAYRASCGFIGADEFHSIISSTDNQHSATLLDQLLGVLDDGEAYKDMLGGRLTYRSGATMWSATQPSRISVGSGLDRRMLIIGIFPDEEDEVKLKKAYDDSFGRPDDTYIIDDIRNKIRDILEGFKFQSVEYTEKYVEFRNMLDLTHAEFTIADRLSLGYTIMRHYDDLDYILRVDIDDDLEGLLYKMSQDRLLILDDPIKEVILTHMGDKVWTRTRLLGNLVKKGISREDASKVLSLLVASGIVKATKIKRSHGRPTITYQII